METIWKEAVVAYFEVLSRKLSEHLTQIEKSSARISGVGSRRMEEWKYSSMHFYLSCRMKMSGMLHVPAASVTGKHPGVAEA